MPVNRRTAHFGLLSIVVVIGFCMTTLVLAQFGSRVNAAVQQTVEVAR